jgi:hypothetical protein
MFLGDSQEDYADNLFLKKCIYTSGLVVFLEVEGKQQPFVIHYIVHIIGETCLLVIIQPL